MATSNSLFGQNRRRSAFSAAALMLILFVFQLLCSCSEPEEGTVGYLDYTPMFDSAFRMRLVAPADTLIRDQPVEVRISTRPLYSGCGRIRIYGRGGGNIVGHMSQPLSLELGTAEIPIEYAENEISIASFTFTPTIEYNSFAFEVFALWDSVVVGESMSYIGSVEEGNLVFSLPPEVGYGYYHIKVVD